MRSVKKKSKKSSIKGKRRIKNFKRPELYTATEVGQILRKDRTYIPSKDAPLNFEIYKQPK